MYDDLHYIDAVQQEAERSMHAAVEEVKSMPHYEHNGEVYTIFYVGCTYVSMTIVQWVITDARHDSTANAYHTTVPCMTGSYV